MGESLRGSGLRQSIESATRTAGLWVLVANAAVLVVAALSYFHLFYVAGDVSARERTLVLETALTVLCVVALGIITSNRLNGPWVALRRVCDTVHRGDLEARLSVHPDDATPHVQMAADSFNRMLGGMQEQLRGGEAAPLFVVSDRAS